MKKKIWAICLTLVLALAAFAISGCSLFNNVGTISWKKEPAKVYTLTNQTNLNDLSFELTVQLKDNSETITVSYPATNEEDKAKITVKGFDTTRTGTYTATVTYDGKLSLSFSYKVTDGKFADGTGTLVDPYIVNTAGQFQNMLDQKSFNYYKLGNSIDLTGVPLRMANKGQDATSAEAWVGELDGAGYIVSGISEVQTPDGEPINKYNEIFGRVARDSEKFVLKNITFDFASSGKSATMGLVTGNGENGVLEFNNVKLTGYINAANSGNSNISPYVSFLQRKVPGDKVAPLKSVTFTDCESNVQILNAYATSLVAGFASSQFVLPAGSVKFTNCKFNGLIEGSEQQGVGAFFTNNNTDKAAYVFTGCSVGESAKIIKTAGLGTENAKYKCGNVCFNGVTEIDGITGTVKVDESLKAFKLEVNNGLLECSVEGAVDYKIYAVGKMYYFEDEKAKSGAFRYVQPAEKVENGNLTHNLLKIKSDKTPINKTEYKDNTDTTYGSELIVKDKNNDKALIYYCNDVCDHIKVTSAKVIVVAYKMDANTKKLTAIAIGTYAGVNLDA